MSIDTTQSATPPPAATKQAASPLAERLALLYTPPAIPAVPIPELTDAEKAALAHLNEHFGDSLFALPVNKGSDEMAPLTPREMMWLVRLLPDL
jgi:hypothetical protein